MRKIIIVSALLISVYYAGKNDKIVSTGKYFLNRAISTLVSTSTKDTVDNPIKKEYRVPVVNYVNHKERYQCETDVQKQIDITRDEFRRGWPK